MNAFKAFRIHERDGKIAAGFEQMTLEALTAGDVVIRVKYSSINYKDALAATGAGKILRKYPLNGGIDLSGEVVSSTDARYKPGQPVLVTGCGHSETLDGGYAEYARAQGDSVIPLPEGLSLLDAMALGTAGFTTGLAIHRMEQNGQKPSMGPIVVTGASGGVGSIAVDLFAKLGYEVVAVSGKPEADAHPEGARRARRSCAARTSTSASGRSRRRSGAARSTTWAARSSPGSRAPWTTGATSRASASPRATSSRRR